MNMKTVSGNFMNANAVYSRKPQNMLDNKEVNKVSLMINEKMKMKEDVLQLSEEGILRSKVRNIQKVEKLEQTRDEKLENLENKKELYEMTCADIQDVIKSLREDIGEEGIEAELENGDQEISNEGKIEGKVLNDEEIDKAIDRIVDMLDIVERENQPENDQDSISKGLAGIDWRNEKGKAIEMLAKGQTIMEEEISKIAQEIKKLQDEIDEMMGIHVEKIKQIDISDEKAVVEQIDQAGQQEIEKGESKE